MLDNPIICENPRGAVLKYIRDHFDQILPFLIAPNVTFQIRFSVEEHESLTEEELRILKRHEDTSREPSETIDTARWREDRFWGKTNDYIYEFAPKNAYRLVTKIIDDYDGYEGQKTTFLDRNEYPQFVLLNIQKNKRDVPLKRPEMIPNDR